MHVGIFTLKGTYWRMYVRLYLRTYCTCSCYLQLIYIVFARHCFVLVCVVLWSVSAFSLTYSLTHSLTHWPLLSCITFTYFFFNRFVPYSPSLNLLLISYLNSLTPQLTIWLLPPWLPQMFPQALSWLLTISGRLHHGHPHDVFVQHPLVEVI